MGYLIRISLFCLVVILPDFPCQGAFRPFWRKPTNKPKPTLLPPISKDPEFYRTKLNSSFTNVAFLTFCEVNLVAVVAPFFVAECDTAMQTCCPVKYSNYNLLKELREEIPPKNETAKKLITNILRIQPGGKRAIELEDVVIVMDGSGSITSCEFDNGKKAMKGLIEYEQPGIDAKYAMVTFADSSKIEFNFLSRSNASAALSGVKFPNGWTNTQAGLADASDLFTNGSRGFHSRKLVLLLTDGHSNREKEKTVPNANKLKSKGVEVFVIAVGGKHMSGIDEMANVASYPPADFLFRVEKVGDFLQVVQLAIEEVAPGKYEILKDYVSSCIG